MSKGKKWLVAIGVVVAALVLVFVFHAKEREADMQAIQRDAAPLLAALERHKTEKGSYPKDLAPLIPGTIASAPACPEGKPAMAYRFEEPDGFELFCPTGWLLKFGYRSAVGKWETYE
jgi:hypothetical protein